MFFCECLDEESVTADQLRTLLAMELNKAAANGDLSDILEKLGPLEEETNRKPIFFPKYACTVDKYGARSLIGQ